MIEHNSNNENINNKSINNNNNKGKKNYSNKHFLKAFLVMILYGILSYEFPYSNKSMLTVLIPPIHIGNGTLHLAGIVPLIFLIWFVKLITTSDRYEGKKFFVFLIVVFLFTPVTDAVHDVINFPLYQFQEDVRLIEVEESFLSFSFMQDMGLAKVKLKLKGHKGFNGPFKVALELDDEIIQLMDLEDTSSEEYYINSGEDTLVIEFPFKARAGQVEALYDMDFYKKEYHVIFYNKGNTSRHYRNDEY